MTFKPSENRAEELFVIQNANMVVGNIIGIGSRWLEPQGEQKIVNETTGESCEIKYHDKKWKNKNDKNQSIEAIIRDKDGNKKMMLTGKYNVRLTAENIATGEKFVTYEVPEVPKQKIDSSKIHVFNCVALQINHMSDVLRAKLPQTDSRLREDIRLWENSQSNASQTEMNRLYKN